MAKAKVAIPDSDIKQAVHARRLACFDVVKNNKKFWNGIVLPDGRYFTEYGIVGVTHTQSEPKHLGVAGGTTQCDKDAKKKLNYKGDKAAYQELDLLAGSPTSQSSSSGRAVPQGNLLKIATDQITTKTPLVTDLIKFLVQTNRHTVLGQTNMQFDESAGTFSTPLGIVTAAAIANARVLLNTIGGFIGRKVYDHPDLNTAVNNYLMAVPQNVGTKLNIRVLFPDSAALQKQNGILDALDASVQAIMSAPTSGDKKKKKVADAQVFSVKLDLVEDGKIIDKIRRKYQKDKGSHSDVATLDVKRAFVVDINIVREAFEKRGRSIGNVQQLWHGSSVANLLSILKGGLIIPPSSSSHVTGRLFGDGIYASSNASKALRYSTGGWGGRTSSRTFLFLVDFAMGKPYLPSGYGGFHRVPSGYDSCWAKAGSAGVMNDERIVYQAYQANLVFLLEMSSYGR